MAQHRGSVVASHPATPSSILGIPEELFILDVAKIYRWSVESLIMLIEPSSTSRKKLVLQITNVNRA